MTSQINNLFNMTDS